MHEKETWTPLDFITAGALCPPAQIRATLADVRKRSEADLSILVVVAIDPVQGAEQPDGRPLSVHVPKFFQSLLYCSCSDPETEATIQSQLILARPDVPCEMRLETVETDSYDRLCRTDLCKVLPDIEFARRYTYYTLRWQPNPVTLGVSIAVGLLQAFHQHKEETQPYNLLGWLAVRVNASAPVHIYKSLEHARRVDKEIDRWKAVTTTSDCPPKDDAEPGEQLNRFYQEVVRTACRLTQSDLASLYIAQHTPDTLERVASCGTQFGWSQLDVKTNHSVVTTCFDRGRPFFINDIRHFGEMHPNIQYKCVFEGGTLEEHDTIAELAVPIHLPSTSTEKSWPLGVLNVEKKNADYTYQDFVALRTLAQALAEHRSHFLTDQAHSSIARLVDPQLRSDEGRTSSAEHLLRGNTRFFDVERYPAEFLLARPELYTAITAVAGVTRCHHITIRFLDLAGNLLIRAVEHPVGSGYPQLKSIPVKDPTSVNAWVARNGRECYLPQVTQRSTYADYEGLTSVINPMKIVRSEYCLPIFVQGFLVGTLDLESTFHNAFEADRHLIRAVLQQIRLLLRNAQRLFEEQIVSQFSILNLSVHEIGKRVKDLHDIEVKAGPPLSVDIVKIRTRLSKVISSLGQDTESEVSTPRRSLREILAAAAEDQQVSDWLRWENQNSPLYDLCFDSSVTRCLHLVLREVFDNGLPNLLNLPAGAELAVGVRDRRRAGRQYAVVSVSHERPQNVDLSDWTCGSAYRVPLKREGQQHYGAFLVGALLRSVGGDIRLSVPSPGDRVRTILEIPFPRRAEEPIQAASRQSVWEGP